MYRGTSRSTPHYNRAHPKAINPPAFVGTNLGEVVATFSVPSFSRDATPVRVEDLRPISSYSWIESKTPTIAVPGSPNVWSNVNPTRVPQDSGFTFIDQNSYRMSTKHPLAPIFAAVDSFVGDYDYPKLDIVSDRNNLRKLLRWASGSPDLEDFRIDIDLAGNTCLFTRREAKDSEHVVGFRGFGHEYEKAATRTVSGLENATGHHRIITMDFGGHQILLRFEVDACTAAAPQPRAPDDDDLVAALSSLNISSSKSKNSVASIQGIVVQQSPVRALVPQSSLIELKTRAAHKPLDWNEVYPQLYLSQTGYLYLAKHTRGNFEPVEKTKLADMSVHAARAENAMAKLKTVLDEVLAKVRAAGSEGEGREFSLVCKGSRLQLYKRAGGKTVPQEIVEKFV